MIRYGWWEDTVTTHTDLRAAYASALTRTVDVDEDIGVAPALSLPRVSGGVGKQLAATTAAMAQIPLHTTPRGWELSAHPSLESRRTAGHLREQWDLAEEILPGRVERVLVHVLGPWSLGAQVEYRGHSVIADRPAFKDMALTLGEAVHEYCERLSRAIGAEVAVRVHEPDVNNVLEGLPGATQFHQLDPVDREIVEAVWRRFDEQVGVDVLLSHSDVSLHSLQDSAIKDAVGARLGEGKRLGVRVPSGMGSDELAKSMMRLWKQWTLPAEQLPELVNFVVPEGVRTPAEASTVAAIARHAAAKLWRN